MFSMIISNEYAGHSAPLIALFEETFTASEGAEEGAMIAQFVANMLKTPPKDFRVYMAWEEGILAGAIVFSRLCYQEDPRTVFILSPVAILPSYQKKKIGQGLIHHGLAALKAEGVDVVLTYGDPAYYQKVGFGVITEEIAKAPLPLSMPEGWLGQSLTGDALRPLRGSSTCVAALNFPALW
ncbi:MAG: GNAT family N-acetyltransferase [Halocynthiibacter sp.]